MWNFKLGHQQNELNYLESKSRIWYMEAEIYNGSHLLSRTGTVGWISWVKVPKCVLSIFCPLKASITMKDKNNHDHVTTQKKIQQIHWNNFSVGCINPRWCCLFQDCLPVKILTRSEAFFSTFSKTDVIFFNLMLSVTTYCLFLGP